nr:hypothetical protein CFP56_24241 [Quercus suber]POE58974.1 hypothetical protein CFP56_24244 [Quercus suber]
MLNRGLLASRSATSIPSRHHACRIEEHTYFKSDGRDGRQKCQIATPFIEQQSLSRLSDVLSNKRQAVTMQDKDDQGRVTRTYTVRGLKIRDCRQSNCPTSTRFNGERISNDLETRTRGFPMSRSRIRALQSFTPRRRTTLETVFPKCCAQFPIADDQVKIHWTQGTHARAGLNPYHCPALAQQQNISSVCDRRLASGNLIGSWFEGAAGCEEVIWVSLYARRLWTFESRSIGKDLNWELLSLRPADLAVLTRYLTLPSLHNVVFTTSWRKVNCLRVLIHDYLRLV